MQPPSLACVELRFQTWNAHASTTPGAKLHTIIIAFDLTVPESVRSLLFQIGGSQNEIANSEDGLSSQKSSDPIISTLSLMCNSGLCVEACGLNPWLP